MALKLEDKKIIVDQVNNVASRALSAVVVDYRGLTVAEMTDLRDSARKAKVYLRVIRNTLARRAIENTDFSCLEKELKGPLCFVFSLDEPGAAARVIRDFIKKYEKLEVVALSINRQLLTPDNLKTLSELPSREEAIAMLLRVMLAPVNQFVRTVAETYTKFVRVLARIQQS